MATLFEGIEKRVISGESRTPGLTKGTYVVAIDDVIFKKTRAAGDAFIVEFTVKALQFQNGAGRGRGH